MHSGQWLRLGQARWDAYIVWLAGSVHILRPHVTRRTAREGRRSLIGYKVRGQTAIDPPRIGGRMSSATTKSSTVPSPPLAVAPRSVPTLDDLYEMTSEPDERVVIRGMDWAFYEQLADSIPDRCSIHVDYDGKDVEIMSPGLIHDSDKRLWLFLRFRGLQTGIRRNCFRSKHL